MTGPGSGDAGGGPCQPRTRGAGGLVPGDREAACGLTPLSPLPHVVTWVCPQGHPILAHAGGGSVPPGLPIPSRPPGPKARCSACPTEPTPGGPSSAPAPPPPSLRPTSLCLAGPRVCQAPCLHHRASPEGHPLSEACAAVTSVPTPPFPPVVDRRMAPRAALVLIPRTCDCVTSRGKGTWRV